VEAVSTASQGRSREYVVREELRRKGWHFIMRAAASKGPADLAMAHWLHGLALIQVGTASKTLGPEQRERLVTASEMCRALPVLATRENGRTSYQIVTRDKPSTWEEFKP
jgi:hypothetical protein